MPNAQLGNIGSSPGRMRVARRYGISELIESIADRDGNFSGLQLYYQCHEPSGTNISDYLATRPGICTAGCTPGVYGPSDGAIEIPDGEYLTSSTAPLSLPAADIMFWFRAAAYPVAESLILGFVEDATHWDKAVTLDQFGNLACRSSSDVPGLYLQYTNFPLNIWTYITVSYNAQGVDGFQYNLGQIPEDSVFSIHGSGDVSPRTFTNVNNVYIGGGPHSPFPGMPGFYDEIAIYQQIANS